jgi:hypothetical protein
MPTWAALANEPSESEKGDDSDGVDSAAAATDSQLEDAEIDELADDSDLEVLVSDFMWAILYAFTHMCQIGQITSAGMKPSGITKGLLPARADAGSFKHTVAVPMLSHATTSDFFHSHTLARPSSLSSMTTISSGPQRATSLRSPRPWSTSA